MNKGNLYEDKAVQYLKLKGYKILEKNFRTKFGEIDIIAKDKKYIVFVEVKARNQNYQGLGLEAVDKNKRDRIRKVALCYASKDPVKPYRFDVLEITYQKDYYLYNLIKGAFDFEE